MEHETWMLFIIILLFIILLSLLYYYYYYYYYYHYYWHLFMSFFKASRHASLSSFSFLLLHPIPAVHLLSSSSSSISLLFCLDLPISTCPSFPFFTIILYCPNHLRYDLYNAQKDGTWALPDCADPPTFHGVLPKPGHFIEKRPCLCTERKISPRQC